MAKHRVEVEIELSEYFDKYGFNDGNGGAAEEMGYAFRDDAERILNEELKAAGLKHWEVVESDVMSSHNDCTLEFKRHAEVIDSEASNGELWLARENDYADEIVKIQTVVWPKAEARFEEYVGGRCSDPALDALARCAFVLKRIVDGDSKALKNARAAVKQATKVLHNAGRGLES